VTIGVCILLGIVLLPPLAYLVMKFGTAGYLRAKDRYEKQLTEERKKDYEFEDKRT
jgi:hypothetical protein